jgi:tetratricopeptide (TPR) repeat protein
VSGSLFDQYKAALRRGHLAALAGDLEVALEAYRVAARLVPERALPIASQGIVLHRLDRWAEAAEAFDLALRAAPDDEAVLRARARAREARGLRSEAATDFERLAIVLDTAGRSADAAEAARRAADLEPSSGRAALADRFAAVVARARDLPAALPAPTRDAPPADALVAVEVEFAAEPAAEAPAAEPAAAEAPAASSKAAPPAPMDAASVALAKKIAELGTQPGWVEGRRRHARPAAGGVGADGKLWPSVDLPSPAPPPLEGPPPDAEALFVEAAELIAAGDTATARERMLLAATVHRAAGRLDAALEVCLQLLTTAPGDPWVHLAIANLQLDRGWTGLATEKINLLLRLTSLTGDTQAEADVHGLAAERLRDDAQRPAAAR